MDDPFVDSPGSLGLNFKSLERDIAFSSKTDTTETGLDRIFPWHRATKQPRFRREIRRDTQSAKTNTPILGSRTEIAELQKAASEASVRRHDRIQKGPPVYHSLSNRFRKHMKSPESLIPKFQSLRIRPRTASDGFSLTPLAHESDPFGLLDSPIHTTTSNIVGEAPYLRTPVRSTFSYPFTDNVISQDGNAGPQLLKRSYREPSNAVTARPPFEELIPEWLRRYHQQDNLESDTANGVRPLGCTQSASWRDPEFRKLISEIRKNEAERQGHLPHGGIPSNSDEEENPPDVLQNASMAQFVVEMSRTRLEKGRKSAKGKTTPKRRGFGGKAKPDESDITSHGYPSDLLHRKMEYVRQVTGTKMILHSPDDPKPARGNHDARHWYAKNLKCIRCTSACAVCQRSCCVYETARRTSTTEASSTRQRAEAQKLLTVIDCLGHLARDVSTFSMCSVPGGCGRLVCPECCGACPVIGCLDIQCKECKPDPWSPCDWHEENIRARKASRKEYLGG